MAKAIATKVGSGGGGGVGVEGAEARNGTIGMDHCPKRDFPGVWTWGGGVVAPINEGAPFAFQVPGDPCGELTGGGASGGVAGIDAIIGSC